jgi:hypothetical protein
MTYPVTLSQANLLAAQPEPFATVHASHCISSGKGPFALSQPGVVDVEEVNMKPGCRWRGEDSAMSTKFRVPPTCLMTTTPVTDA